MSLQSRTSAALALGILLAANATFAQAPKRPSRVEGLTRALDVPRCHAKG